jgi:hypothetical protein
MNIPPVSIAAGQGRADRAVCRPRAAPPRHHAVGHARRGQVVHRAQVAQHFGVPLVDLRLTTIEPVDIRGAIYADEVQGKTVWFPPEFLPAAEQPEGILFLDELTAADQRLQISAYSLILDRRVGHYRLPDGWQVVAAGNASFHGACQPRHGHGAGRPHVPLQRAGGDRRLSWTHALAQGFAPEVMAYLKVRPDKLDDTQAQLAADHLVGASPRGWEDVSNVLKSAVRRAQAGVRAGPHRRGQRGRILRRAARDAGRRGRGALLAASPAPTPWRCCRARWTACTACSTACWRRTEAPTLARALEIVEQLPDMRSDVPLPVREAQTLAMELLMQQALERGLEAALLDSPAYRRYAERRRAEGLDGA